MNKVLETTKFVVDNSEQVKISQDRVIDFSNDFEHGTVKHWLSAAPFDFSHFKAEEKLNFLFIFNALSFSYWGEPKWIVDYKNKKYDGAWGLIVALERAIKNKAPILSFDYCAKIDKEDFSKILKGNVEIPLLIERWQVLNEIGQVVVNKFAGKLSNLIDQAEKDAQKLIELIIANFPSFQDTAVYKKKEIYFQKRVQLFVADIYQIFNGQKFGDLRNIDQLTACADYKLPQILRKFRILEYTPKLAEKIDQQEEIKHNSTAEIEIRANTIWAVEMIKNEVKKRQPKIMSIEINDHLWLATQEKFPDDKPYHRTRTTAY